MVKSFVSIFAALLLLAGAAVFEWLFVEDQFNRFGEEISALDAKLEEETAETEDVRAVLLSWDEHKSKLHVIIPHNDISRIDDYLAETLRLVGERDYPLARAKLNIVVRLCETIPATYHPFAENVF